MEEVNGASGRGSSERAYWICQWAGWGVYGLARFYAGLLFVLVPWPRLAAEILLLHGVGLGITHGLRWLAVRHRWKSLRWPQLVWRIVVCSLLAGAPIGFATAFMAVDALNNTAVVDAHGAVFAGQGASLTFRVAVQVANWGATFAAWLVLYFVISRLREQQAAVLRQSELTRALQLAELRLLKSQLNPHFLFNALNTVRSLISSDPSRAQDAVTRLANTLRYTLNSSQDELVTLAQELEIVRDYLELETARFEERLTIHLEISEDALGARIPVMLLQTVVENAIKHGIAELPSGGLVRIRAALRGDSLALEVENPTSSAPSGRARVGVGLKNAAERLRLLFGARASINLDRSTPNVAIARIEIPKTP